MNTYVINSNVIFLGPTVAENKLDITKKQKEISDIKHNTNYVQAKII